MSQPLETLRPAYPPIRVSTSDAVAKQVARVVIPAGSGACIDVEFVAYRSTGVANFFRRVFRAKNIGGVISIVSSNATIPDDNPSVYAVAAAVLANGIGINVTGAAAQSVAWTVHVVSLTQ